LLEPSIAKSLRSRSCTFSLISADRLVMILIYLRKRAEQTGLKPL
jgi:hypothetical protein